MIRQSMGPRGPNRTSKRLIKEPKIGLSSKLSISYLIFLTKCGQGTVYIKRFSETLIYGPQGALKDLKKIQKWQKIVLIKKK